MWQLHGRLLLKNHLSCHVVGSFIAVHPSLAAHIFIPLLCPLLYIIQTGFLTAPLIKGLGFNHVFHRETVNTVYQKGRSFVMQRGSHSRKPRDVENTYLTGKFTLFYHRISLAGFHPHCNFLTAVEPWQHSYHRACWWLCCPQRGGVCLMARAITCCLNTACPVSPAGRGGMRRVATYPEHSTAVVQWERALAYGRFFTIISLMPLKRRGVFLNDDKSQSVTRHFSPSGLVLQRLQQCCNVTAQVGVH